MTRVASAGEMKALSLLLVAAHGRVLEGAERSPTYLLDDVDAELAQTTLAAVWRRVFSGDRQVVASSSRPQAWLTLEVQGLFGRWRKGGFARSKPFYFPVIKPSKMGAYFKAPTELFPEGPNLRPPKETFREKGPDRLAQRNRLHGRRKQRVASRS